MLHPVIVVVNNPINPQDLQNHRTAYLIRDEQTQIRTSAPVIDEVRKSNQDTNIELCKYTNSLITSRNKIYEYKHL